jgi:uncharacterized protein YkwD
MGRLGSWGYVGIYLVSLATGGALVACSVETTTIEKHVAPTDPAAMTPDDSPPTNDTPPAGSSGKIGGSSGKSTSGSAGTSGSGGTSGSAGSSGGTSGTSGSAGTSGSGGTSGSSGTSGGTSPFDQFQQHNLAVINQYRATKNLMPVTLDKQLCTFALAGSQELAMDHTPHQHFISASNAGTIWSSGFSMGAAENQGDPNGWYKMSNDPTTNEMMQIDSIQLAMFNEGPGTGEAHGHYMNMMNPAQKRVGVGLLMVGTSLYLTNDFSE